MSMFRGMWAAAFFNCAPYQFGYYGNRNICLRRGTKKKKKKQDLCHKSVFPWPLSLGFLTARPVMRLLQTCIKDSSFISVLACILLAEDIPLSVIKMSG